MRKLGYLGILGLLAVLVAGCAGSGSSDSSSRKAAIGSGAPTAGEGSLTVAAVAAPGQLPANGNPIKVLSWTWGAQNSTTAGSVASGAGAGKAGFEPFVIKKNIDNSSTSFFNLVTLGVPIKTMTFKVGTSLTYTFTNAFVSEQTQSGDGSDGDETVTFMYQKVCQVNAAAGTSPQQCWNVTTNSPS